MVKFDPNTAQNAVEIEKQFAVRAVEQAQTYWNLLEKIAPRALRLTKHDDEIFEHAMRAFPELGAGDGAGDGDDGDGDGDDDDDDDSRYAGLVKIDEEWMKSEDGKRRWREFCESYKDKVADYNFGSLIRTDARDEYAESNTMFVTRIQFYAYEVARNRLGLNDKVHEKAKAEAEKERAKKEKQKKSAKSS